MVWITIEERGNIKGVSLIWGLGNNRRHASNKLHMPSVKNKIRVIAYTGKDMANKWKSKKIKR